MELPRLQPLYEKYREKGLSIIAIEGFRDRERAVKFIEENKLTYTFLENGEGDQDFVSNLFGVNGYPTSFLIDENGKIMYYHIGFDRGDEKKLEKEILSLLK